MRTFAFAAALAFSQIAGADDAERIVGTWKLVSVLYEDAQTRERTPVLGAHPKGTQIATAKGRWLALVTAEVEAAWNEAWVGTEQVRAYRFEGNLLHLESPPQPHPNIGGRVVRIIVTWEKEE